MISPASSLFGEAVAAFRAGELDRAARLLDEALRLEPAVFDALHLLGVIHGLRRDHAAALEAYERALRIRADHAEIWSNKGNALSGLQRHEAALLAFDQALSLKPDYAEAWYNRGIACRALKRGDEAIACYQRALALDPAIREAWLNLGILFKEGERYAEALDAYAKALAIDPAYAAAWSNRGNVLSALGRHAEALAAYDESIKLAPASAKTWSNTGNALGALGRHAEALAAFERALALQPDYAEACSNKGNALSKLGRHAEALQVYERALALDPRLVEAWSNKGVALKELGRPAAALAAYDQALAIDPAHAESWSNRGVVLNDLGDQRGAIEAFTKALDLKPAYADAWLNKGISLSQLKRYAEALQHYRQALALAPDNADAHWNEALTQLVLGDYAAGWRQYEYRWHTRQHDPDRHAGIPRLSSPGGLARKRVLVWAEQGFGDTLQFCRYLSLLRQGGADTVFEVQPALATLLARQGLGPVVAMGAAAPEVDFQIPLLSLPGLFHTDEHNIPPPVAFLNINPERLLYWKMRLAPRAGRLRIGLACAGNPRHRNDANRSIPLAQLDALRAEGDLYLLQKELREADRMYLERHPEIENLGEALSDFEDSAALIRNLDLVVSVDTAVAHLAGSLGAPVFILLPWAPEWRWRLDRQDTPWYPTATLFRQAAQGDWQSALAALIAAIRHRAGNETPAGG